MIIRSLDIAERQAFDRAVTHPLQTWGWGDFRVKTGVEVERFGFFDNQQLVGGMQLTFHPIPHTPYTAGYFPKGQMPTEEQMDALRELGRRKKALYIKLEPNIAAPCDSAQQLAPAKDFLLQQGCQPGRPLFTKYTFMLDISKSETELLAGMRPKTRYNLRLAEKKGVQVVEDSTEAGMEEYITILKETTKRQRFYAHGPEYFRTMWQSLKDSGMIHILKAQVDGKTIVAWILFTHNNVLYYPYGASTSELREFMPSNLQMWRAIQFGKQWGCTSFDMWGSLGPDPSPKDPWYGFHTFKQGYGATLYEFVGTYDLVLMPQQYQLFTLADSLRWKFLRFKARF